MLTLALSLTGRPPVGYVCVRYPTVILTGLIVTPGKLQLQTLYTGRAGCCSVCCIEANVQEGPMAVAYRSLL